MGLFSNLFCKKNQKTDHTVKERNLLSIEVGDIVTYDLIDYEVVGKITYRDHGYEWYAYQLLGNGGTIWLAAEMDDELEAGIYRKITLPVHEPFPQKIEYDGKMFYLDEEGHANVTGEGRSKQVNGQSIHYADYCDEEEEHFLSVEKWGSDLEVSYGYPIEEYEMKIIAGSK